MEHPRELSKEVPSEVMVTPESVFSASVVGPCLESRGRWTREDDLGDPREVALSVCCIAAVPQMQAHRRRPSRCSS